MAAHTGGTRARSSKESSTEVNQDKLNKVIERMRSKMSEQPLVLRVESKFPYRLDETPLRLALRGSPFDVKDAYLQYTTYKKRDELDLLSLFQYANLEGRTPNADTIGSRVLLGVRNGSHTPTSNATPRKKINLSDYQRRKKLSEQDGASNVNTPSSLGVEIEQSASGVVTSNATSVPAQNKMSTAPATGSLEKPRVDERKGLTNPKANCAVAKYPDGMEDSEERAQVEGATSTITSKDRTGASRGIANEISTAQDEKKPRNKKDVIDAPGKIQNSPPPWLSDSFHDSGIEILENSLRVSSASSPKAFSDPNTLRGNTASSLTSDISELSFHLPTEAAICAAEKIAKGDTENKSATSSAADRSFEQPESNSRPTDIESNRIKLIYGKRNVKRINKILRCSPSRNDTSEGTNGVSKANVDIHQDRKRPLRESQKEFGSTEAKKVKLEADLKAKEDPKTPESRARGSSILDETPSTATKQSAHSTVTKDISITPVKHLKVLNQAVTPQGLASTLRFKQGGKLTPEVPENDGLVSAQTWKAEYSRLTKLATALKRKAQSSPSASNGKSEHVASNTSKLPAVETIASLMYFMAALCALDQCQRSWEGWWDLKDFSIYVSKVCQHFPHLFGLAHMLRSVIFMRVINVLGYCGKVDDAKDANALKDAAKFMEESANQAENHLPRKVLADDYPEAHAMSLHRPLAMLAKPMTDVRMGWKLIDQWVAKNKVKGWAQQLEEGACGQL